MATKTNQTGRPRNSSSETSSPVRVVAEKPGAGSPTRGCVAAPATSIDAGILEAAEIFASLTEPRPGRQPLTPADAVAELRRMCDDRRLDPDASAAVVEGAGLPRPRKEHPCGLTDREVDVLRLAARGLSNPQIAAELIISARTVGHHLSHIYDKTGLRTRSGVAVFAAENRLLPG